MRKEFIKELHKRMSANEQIVLLSADLGYNLLDEIRTDFPDRFYNVGAAEIAMIGIAIGLALEKKIVFTYTITPFYFRAFEPIRTYIDFENIPVKMIGSGVDKTYLHDGISHWANDVPDVMSNLKKIEHIIPTDKEKVGDILDHVIETEKPFFIQLSK